ncbi:MAG TPA: glycosyltransferase family 2 protein [Desulfuromonadales bacterium]|nr:glycosyltransferase family 2 protein [Desulfuromonadales bacterium]
MKSVTPDITVIVPLLNEAAELPELFATLNRQEGCRFELILSDGGSSDGSQRIITSLMESCRFPVKLIQSEVGRGRQMNAGAAIVAAPLLLFLHADSRFDDERALSSGVAVFGRHDTTPPAHFAARYRLRFRRSVQVPSLAYFFYEAKARLPKSECIRGDQGFLVSRSLFDKTGGFDESLPFLEDVRFASSVDTHTEWLLLPSAISTSARRFEREGLRERQILNAIIINNTVAGWNDFFTELPALYRPHSISGKRDLAPLLAAIHTLINRQTPQWKRSFWQSTGRHVAGNAWQLLFWLDVRNAFRNSDDPDFVTPRWLSFYEQRLATIFSSVTAATVAQLLTKAWLRWILITKASRTA